MEEEGPLVALTDGEYESVIRAWQVRAEAVGATQSGAAAKLSGPLEVVDEKAAQATPPLIPMRRATTMVASFPKVPRPGLTGSAPPT